MDILDQVLDANRLNFCATPEKKLADCHYEDVRSDTSRRTTSMYLTELIHFLVLLVSSSADPTQNQRTMTNAAFGLGETQKRLSLASSVYLKHLAWRNWHLRIHKLHEKNLLYSSCRCRAITSQWPLLPSWLTLEMQAIHTIIFSLIVWLWVVIFQPGGTPLTVSKTLYTITMASHEVPCWSPATSEVAGKR